MSTVLVVGKRDSFLEKISDSFLAEGLDVTTHENPVKDVDYILYSTLQEEHGSTAKHIHKLRDKVRETGSRLIIVAADSQKHKEELTRDASKIDERHAYLSSNNPLFTDETWKDLKRLIFSPTYKNSSVAISVQEGKSIPSVEHPIQKPVEKVVAQPARTEPPYENKHPKPKRKKSNLLSFVLLGVSFVMLILLPYLELASGEMLLKSRLEGVGLRSLTQNVLTGANTGFVLYAEIPLLGKLVGGKERLTSQLAKYAKILKEYEEVREESKFLVGAIFNPDEPFSSEQLNSVTTRLDQINNDLGLLIAEIGDTGREYGMFEMRSKTQGLVSFLDYIQDLAEDGDSKNFLILLTDASQLRGSSGVVIGYGILKTEAGRVVSLSAFPPEEIDSKLKGEVSPPTMLKKHLNQNAWYFKDSTWSPNFEVSAARASWFLEKTKGERVEGVLVLDTEFLRDLGKARGEVVGDYYSMIQKNGGSFVIEKLTDAYDYLLGDTEAGVEALSKTIQTNLEEKHILVYTKNTHYLGALKEMSWSGEIKDGACLSKENCFDDYLQVVTTNLNGSRQGFRVEKNYKLEIKIDKDKVQHKLTVRRAKAGGDLKDYIRIYIEEGSEMTEPTLLNTATGAQQKLALDKAQESGKTIYGLVVEVPKGEEREVILNWSTEMDEVLNLKQYNFVWQKQPGVIEGEVVLDVNYTGRENPSYFLDPRGRALTRRGSLLYNTVLAQDIDLRLLWK